MSIIQFEQRGRLLMEVGMLLRSIPAIPTTRKSLERSLNRYCKDVRRLVRADLKVENGGYRGPRPSRDWVSDWVSRNDDAVRSLPIYVGGFSIMAILFNRAVSGIAPVADASSSQSRADLLTLGLAVTNVLAGLVWLSIRPKSISVVYPQGVECQKIRPNLPDCVVSELLCCLLQIGVVTESSIDVGDAMVVDAVKLMKGSLYQGVMKSGAQSYLANLSLYPGRSELPFLPANTQAAILQPLGDRGFIILGGDTVRGFTTSDQSWITLIAEKLDATISKFETNPALACSLAVVA